LLVVVVVVVVVVVLVEGGDKVVTMVLPAALVKVTTTGVLEVEDVVLVVVVLVVGAAAGVKKAVLSALPSTAFFPLQGVARTPWARASRASSKRILGKMGKRGEERRGGEQKTTCEGMSSGEVCRVCLDRSERKEHALYVCLEKLNGKQWPH
jgi:hypothetical protein